MLRLSKLAFVLAPCLLAACGGEEPSGPPTFTQVQAQVFQPSCTFAGCHGGAGPAEGLVLESGSHGNIVNVASVQVPEKMLVVPNDEAASYLMDKLLDRDLPKGPNGDWLPMPITGYPLDDARIEMVRAWINAGAPND